MIADLQRKLETAETMAGLHGPIDDNETINYRYYTCTLHNLLCELMEDL